MCTTPMHKDLSYERTASRGSMLLRPAVIRIRQLPALGWDDYTDLNSFQLESKAHDLIAREVNLKEGVE